MDGWRRHGRGERLRLVSALDRQEAAVLRGLVGEVRRMLAERGADAPADELVELTGMQLGPSQLPVDRVLARLLPDFSRDDTELSGMLRSLREPELIDAKDANAAVVLETCPPGGGQVQLTVGQADAWLAALNDVRLALGTALDVTEDMPDELPADEAAAGHLSVYHWLTFVQDSLVQTRGSVR